MGESELPPSMMVVEARRAKLRAVLHRSRRTIGSLIFVPSVKPLKLFVLVAHNRQVRASGKRNEAKRVCRFRSLDAGTATAHFTRLSSRTSTHDRIMNHAAIGIAHP